MFVRLCLLQTVLASTYQQISTISSSQSQSNSSATGTPYFSTFGQSGLQLPFTGSAINYTVTFSFRINSSPSNQSFLFDFGQGPSCWITSQFLQCSTGQQILLSTIAETDMWMQLTYSANQISNQSYVYLDQTPIHIALNGTYRAVTANSVFLGIGSQLAIDSGLIGDVREFYMNSQVVNEDAIPAITSNAKVFQWTAMAYYQFDPALGQLKDSFYNQQGLTVSTASITARLPIFQVDTGTKLVCDQLQLNPIINLPLFNGQQVSPLVKIPNLKIMQQGYQYTMSMWIKSFGGNTYSSQVADGIANRHFFLLEGVFALWFDSGASFRVTTDASKSFQQQSTLSIQIPLRQWVNIQVQIDQKVGLKVNVYASNNMLLSSNVIQVLGDQAPTGNIQLLKNFIGQIKNVQLWQSVYNLPVTSTDPSILSIDFQSQFYSNNQWSSSNGFVLPIAGVSFQQSNTPSDANTGSIGMFNSLASLWDGAGCAQNQVTDLFVNNGALSSQFTMPPSNQLTVEFWFRFKTPPPANLTFNLHSLQTTLSSQWSLTIYVENGLLKCAPFGKSGVEQLIYTGVDVVNETRWQHVSCGLQQQQKVVGQYLAYQNTNQINDVLPITFSLSLASSVSSTPNSVFGQTFQSQLGSSLQSIFFKELRVWSNFQQITDVYNNRFKLLPSTTTPGLQLNYQLVKGNLTIVNRAQNNVVAAQGGTPKLETSTLVLCPYDKFYNAITGLCMTYPYDDIPITYTAQPTQQNGLQITLTNQYRRAPMFLPQQQPNATNMWSINDVSVQQTAISSQRSNSKVLLNPFSLPDSYPYSVNLLQLGNNFWYNTTQKILPRKCLYAVDQKSQASFTKITVIRGNTDLCFNIQVKSIDGCISPFQTQFRQEVSLESSPFIQNLSNQTRFTVVSSNDQANVTACMPGSLQQTMRGNEPINLVFGVYWSSGLPTWSYINNVYQLIIVDPISVDLHSSTQQVDLQQSVVLDAGRTVVSATKSRNGLYFAWTCPQILQMYCDSFDTSPVLEITPQVFQALGGQALTKYNFTVRVWSFQSGSVPLDQKQVYNKTVTLVWAAFAEPVFDIIVPLLPGQSTPAIVSSQDVTLSLNLRNYRQGDPRLSYKWELNPAPLNILFKTSNDGSLFTLLNGALNRNTNYTLKVTVSNVNVVNSIGTTWLNFTTGSPPMKGLLLVAPSQGIMFQTNFIVSLQNWGNSLQVNIWGITDTSLVQIGQSMQQLNQSLTVPPYSLPLIKAIQVDVFDFMGEKTTLSVNVDVQRPQTKSSWTSVSQQIVYKYSGDTLLEQKYLYLAFVAQNCNSDLQSAVVPAQDCLDASEVMITQAAIDLFPLSLNDTSYRAKLVIGSVTQMLNQITQGTMNSTTANQVVSLLQSISGITVPFQNAVQDSNFQSLFLSTIDNLIVYESTQVSVQNLGRRLQTDAQAVINALIVVKNALLDNLCRLNTTTYVKSTHTYIYAQSFDVYDSRSSVQLINPIDNTVVSIPIDKLLHVNKDYNPQVNSVCLQVSFMQSPVPKYQFKNQQVLSIAPTIQVQSLDNLGGRVLQMASLNDLQLTPYRIYIPLDFDEAQFHRNQTMCMNYDANSFTPVPWSSASCSTNYTTYGVMCQCSVLNNFYFGLVNDFTRIEDLPPSIYLSFNWPFVLILVPITFGLLLNCIGYCLDRADEKKIQSDSFYQVSDKLLDALKLNRKYQYKECLYYKLKDIQFMQSLQKLTFWSAYRLVSLNTHPVQSFYHKISYRYSRSVRASVLMLHVATVTFLCLALFVKDQTKNNNAVYIAIAVFAAFWLPFESIWLWCIRVEISTKQEQSTTPTNEVVMTPHCSCLRICFQIFTFVFYLLQCFIIGVFMMGVQTKDYSFRINTEHTKQMLLVWYLCNLSGLVVIQTLRITFVTTVAYLLARRIKQQQTVLDKSYWYWVVPKESVDICLDALWTIELSSKVEKNAQDFTHDQLFETNVKTVAVNKSVDRSQEVSEPSARTVVSKVPPSKQTKLIVEDELDFELKDSDGSFNDDILADEMNDLQDFEDASDQNLEQTNRLHEALAKDNESQIKKDKAAMESTLGTIKIISSTDSQPQNRAPFSEESSQNQLQKEKKDKKDKKDKKKKHKKHKSRKQNDDY